MAETNFKQPKFTEDVLPFVALWSKGHYLAHSLATVFSKVIMKNKEGMIKELQRNLRKITAL